MESPIVSGQKGGAVKPWYRGKAKERLRRAASCGSLNVMLAPSRAAGALVLLLGLAGCGLIEPFETGTPDSVVSQISRGSSPSTGGAPAPTRTASLPAGMTSAQDAAATAGAADPSSVPVSVCYSRLSSTPDKVIAIAARECGSGKPPSLIEQKWDLYACPLMMPVRATFVCGAH